MSSSEDYAMREVVKAVKKYENDGVQPVFRMPNKFTSKHNLQSTFNQIQIMKIEILKPLIRNLTLPFLQGNMISTTVFTALHEDIKIRPYGIDASLTKSLN